MAGEIALNIGMTVRKGDDPYTFKVDVPSHILSRDLAGSRRASNTQNIGTSAHEAVVVGDLSSAGYAFFKNLDATNYLQIGLDVSGTFYPFIRLGPGDESIVKLESLTIYAKAHTGACDLDYTIVEA